MADANRDGTFLRVRCDTCGSSDNWTRCERCGRQSLFTLRADGFGCACGADYGHAICACGVSVAPGGLEAVPFEQGPLSWSDLELDRRKLAGLGLVVVLGLGVLWVLLGGL